MMLDQTLLLLRNAIWMMRELELQTDPKSTDKKLQQHSACIDKMLSRWEGGALCVIFTILVSFSRDNAQFASKAKINVF